MWFIYHYSGIIIIIKSYQYRNILLKNILRFSLFLYVVVSSTCDNLRINKLAIYKALDQRNSMLKDIVKSMETQLFYKLVSLPMTMEGKNGRVE